MLKLTDGVETIFKKQGCVVPCLGNSERRCSAEGTKSSNRGGNLQRSTEPIKKHWTHPDASDCTSQLIKEVLLKVERKKIIKEGGHQVWQRDGG